MFCRHLSHGEGPLPVFRPCSPILFPHKESPILHGGSGILQQESVLALTIHLRGCDFTSLPQGLLLFRGHGSLRAGWRGAYSTGAV